MNSSTTRYLLPLFALLFIASSAPAVTVQSEDNILPDGSAYLWVEAESYLEGADMPEVGFVPVSKDNPIQTILEDSDGNEVVNGGMDVLPEDTDASGGEAIFAQLGGGGTATWQVEFAIPATYHMYIHWSMWNRDGNTNYGNEDSFYVAPDFNLNARDDWIGYEGVDLNGDPKTGDSNRDGYIDGFPTIAQNWVTGGGIEAHNDTNEEFYEGQYHWYWVQKANDMDENDAFVSFDGHAIQFDVTDEELGTVLDYQIAYREPYGSIDGILFSTSDRLLEDFEQEELDEFFLNMGGAVSGDFDNSGLLDLPDVNMLSTDISTGTGDVAFDVTGDGSVDDDDLNMWVKSLRRTWFGDANLDDEFNSGDLVSVFQEGKFELDEDAGWHQGDWNADGRFNSSDLVRAFQDGGFERGPVAAVASVPEPSAFCLSIFGLTLMLLRRRANGNSYRGY